jgi:ribonuclease R
MAKRERQGPPRQAPGRDELLRYIAEADGEVTKRDLVRAFGLKGSDRTALKQALRELGAEGMLEAGPRRRVRSARHLPSVAVLEVIGTDLDGDPIARPVKPPEGAAAARVVLVDQGRHGTAPGVGERVLARLRRQDEDLYEGRIIRVLPAAPDRMVGVLRRTVEGFRVEPIGVGGGGDMRLRAEDAGGAEAGEIVAVERTAPSKLGLARVRVTDRLGRPGDPRTISLTMAQAFGLPVAFPPKAEAAARAAAQVEPRRRLDLRDLPLVTIDGADARDFDDAVCARPDDAPNNPGGFIIRVAIADVAHYVRPGSPLDLEARRRGNSVYFPDRVLPMLPHELSNDLCSLRPGEDRACLTVLMRIDRRGRKLDHRFARALMCSRARLTYEQIQAARDGQPDPATGPLAEEVIAPLYGAFAALLEARRHRGTLDLDLPETMIELGDDGRPSSVRARPRLDSHRLIEEFMILANVAAAESLEAAGSVCMYRVHDRPDPVKLDALADLLERFGLPGKRGTLARPKDLARLLDQVREHELAPQISTLVLRAQSQAVYSPHNIGHFGLNLGRYAHFTSPIRRYADLLVHRALIRALKLGAGRLGDGATAEAWAETGAAISRAERRAMEAERAAQARFVALFMADKIGAHFEGTITGVQRFGLFVQLDGVQAEGLVPVSTLGREYFVHDLRHHALTGGTTGTTYVLGDRVEIELADADPLTGQLGLRLIGHEPGAASRLTSRAARRPAPRQRRPVRRSQR